jgi:hypothetical protein
MTSETLVSDFSATIPAMIVSLRHFFGWLVTIFRPREDLVLDFLPSYLLYYHEDRTHLGLRLAARFLNNSVPRVSREFDANGHGSGTFFVDGFVWELVRSEVRDLSDQHCDELSLNREKDGQHVYANVGQRIVICLQTIGGGHYGRPQISSKAVRFDRAEFAKRQNPGGPTQIYYFTATAEGKAQISIPHTDSNPTVTFMIQVRTG